MIHRTGFDPVDLQLDRAGAVSSSTHPTRAGNASRTWSRGHQSSMLLLLGIGLGAQGLGVLTAGALAVLDPIVTVALAAMGVLAAFSAEPAAGQERRLVPRALFDVLLTGTVVSGGLLLAAPLVAGPDVLPWRLALFAGLCASASAAGTATIPYQGGGLAGRLADRGMLIAIVAGGLFALAGRDGSLAATLAFAAQTLGLSGVIAIVGWLLLTRTTAEPDQHVFTAATLLLLGGLADALSVSALLGGTVAGFVWRWTGGTTRERIGSDLIHVQHPLVGLVLIVAGARVIFSPTVVALAIAYSSLRMAGKVASGRLFLRSLVPPGSPPARALMRPGILGVVLALSMLGVAGPGASDALSVVVIGTITAQLLAGRGEDRA